MIRTQPKTEPDQSEPEGPAKITPLHVRNRPATDNDMRPIIGKTAYRKWTPLEAAYEQGKLAGGDPKFDAKARLNAGLHYASIWDTAQTSGRDSTQAMNVSRSHGGGGLSDVQGRAINDLVAIDSHMGRRDRIIIRMVCGGGYFPSEAVRMVSEDYTKAVSPRFREALDALIEAIAAVSKNPGRVNLEVRS